MKIVAGIVEKDGEFLFLRRAKEEGSLVWAFPAGKMEAQDATEEDGVMREVWEETGIKCHPVRRLGEWKHPDTHVQISYWLCKYDSGDIVLGVDEVIAAIWTRSSNILQLSTTRLFPAVVQYLQDNQNS